MRQHVDRDDQTYDHAEGECRVFDEKRPDFAERREELVHAFTAVCRFAKWTAIAETVRNAARSARSAMSSPSQGKRRPSPIQNTPNAERRTPTANFSVFSGTRE